MTRFHLFSLLLAYLMLTLTGGCGGEEICDPTLDVRLSTSSQYFTIKYQNAAGKNYLDLWDPQGVVVYRNANSNENPPVRIVQIDPGHNGVTFGPFAFTEKLVDPATGRPKATELLGKTVSYDFFIRKDGMGVDTFTVVMSMKYQGCNLVWNTIQYFRNGVLLPSYTNNEVAEMTFVE